MAVFSSLLWSCQHWASWTLSSEHRFIISKPLRPHQQKMLSFGDTKRWFGILCVYVCGYTLHVCLIFAWFAVQAYGLEDEQCMQTSYYCKITIFKGHSNQHFYKGFQTAYVLSTGVMLTNSCHDDVINIYSASFWMQFNINVSWWEYNLSTS